MFALHISFFFAGGGGSRGFTRLRTSGSQIGHVRLPLLAGSGGAVRWRFGGGRVGGVEWRSRYRLLALLLVVVLLWRHDDGVDGRRAYASWRRRRHGDWWRGNLWFGRGAGHVTVAGCCPPVALALLAPFLPVALVVGLGALSCVRLVLGFLAVVVGAQTTGAGCGWTTGWLTSWTRHITCKQNWFLSLYIPSYSYLDSKYWYCCR